MLGRRKVISDGNGSFEAKAPRARKEFDNTLEDLENAIAEARRETRNEP
jgi:F0F1-type ATP synthase membrane subunit b/b'